MTKKNKYQAMRRFLVYDIEESDKVMAMRYDHRRKRLKFGGPKIGQDWYEQMVGHYFGNIRFNWRPAGGRISTEIKLKEEVWNKGKEKIEARGYRMVRVTSFRRMLH